MGTGVSYRAAYYDPVVRVTVTPDLNRDTEITYAPDITSVEQPDQTITLEKLECLLANDSGRTLMPNGLLFEQGGNTIIDRDGLLIKNPSLTTGAGTTVGSVDYASGKAELTDWVADQSKVDILAMLLARGQVYVKSVYFKTTLSPMTTASTEVRGVTLSGKKISSKADSSGNFSNADMQGTIREDLGLVEMVFTEPVLATSIKYNGVALKYIPLNKDVIGIDTTRLPIDGRVPIFRNGDLDILHHTDTKEIANPVANQEIDLGRERLSMANLKDANGVQVNLGMWSVDLDAGKLTLNNTFTLTGYDAPLKCSHTIEEGKLIEDVDVSGRIKHTSPYTRDFPEGSYLSSCIVINDVQARVPYIFDQKTWNNEWYNTVQGDEVDAQFDSVNYPIRLTNRATIEEDWALEFVSSTSIKVIGRNVGVLGVFSINENVAPINPNFNAPYFVIEAGAFKTGWAAGNVIRFRTLAAAFPFQLVRCIDQGSQSKDNDAIGVCVRANVGANK